MVRQQERTVTSNRMSSSLLRKRRNRAKERRCGRRFDRGSRSLSLVTGHVHPGRRWIESSRCCVQKRNELDPVCDPSPLSRYSGAKLNAACNTKVIWIHSCHEPVISDVRTYMGAGRSSSTRQLKNALTPSPPRPRPPTTMSEQALAFLDKVGRHLCVVLLCPAFNSGVVEPRSA